ncbi:unnamed protein product [Adineta ricciae]|uniref:Uncharacterized protein n=1 Tax=Adineta ricciae TaxID=249248 RepID=A0A814PX97_ADIRI|nr:unnamed protein product [Adineta ricciae]
MYHRTVPTRILTSVGIGLLIFSLVFGWVSFSVPDWLQFYERDGLKGDVSFENSTKVFKKFGLWYKCIFSASENDFICTLWNRDSPSFVRVVQVLVPFGLALGCLSLLSACIGFMCQRVFVTSVLFAALFAFLSFIFTAIGVTVFANESVVYVERLKLPDNDSPRRWGMWLLVPNLILSFITSICFIIASILYWCDYRSMQVTGIFSHSGDKYNGSVCKAPSDGNTTSGMKQQFQYQDYPNTCYQINGLNHPQQNPMGYPPPPTYPGVVNPGYQPAPPSLFGYSRPGSPSVYPNGNFDPYHSRHLMTENSEFDECPHVSRSRHRSHSRSRHHSRNRSRSYSPQESTAPVDSTPKATQFVPIPVPYYQPQSQVPPPAKPSTQTSAMASSNTSQPMSYVLPQNNQQFIEGSSQTIMKPQNMLKYNVAQPSMLVQNPTQPVYTIAYRTNNNGNNIIGSNLITGPPAPTYVTAARNSAGDIEISSFNSDSDSEQKTYPTTSKRKSLKKVLLH